MYRQIYDMCLNVERVMEMFSKELQELDRNTVHYMIDEMQNEINRMGSELQKSKEELQQKDEELQQKDSKIEELMRRISELEVQKP